MADEKKSSTELGGEKELAAHSLKLNVIVAVGGILLLAGVIFGAFYTGQGAKGSMDGITKFNFEIFAKEAVKELPDNDKPNSITISDDIPTKLLGRIERNSRQIAGGYVLWVDDSGALRNSWARRALSSLGVAVDTVKTTDEALALLQSGLAYDVVITDLLRPGDVSAPCYPGQVKFVSAGCHLIQVVRDVCGDHSMPIIIHAANLDKDAGQPAYVIGMTNRFDELIELVIDALERRPANEEGLVVGPCARNPVP